MFDVSSLFAGPTGLFADFVDFGQDLYMQNENQKWAEMMASTGVQRRVKDLQAAGLSPMLAYGNIGAAAAPGSMGSPSGSSVAGSGASSAQASLIRAQTGLIEAQRENIVADTVVKRSTVPLQSAQASSYGAQASNYLASASQAEAQTRFIEAQIPKIVEEIKELQSRQYSQSARGALDDMSVAQMNMLLPHVVSLATSNAIREKLGLVKAENMSEAEKTWWKKNVAPFLSDVESVVGSIGGVASAVRKNLFRGN